MINGLVHCPNCKKTKQIPYAFRRPTTCHICKVNYIHQCAICKKKYIKFKTLRLHLQFKCGKEQPPKKNFKPNESILLQDKIKHEHGTLDSGGNFKNSNCNESFQEINVEVKQENDGNMYNTGSNLDMVHTVVEPGAVRYVCLKCNKFFKSKYRKNSHEKYCDKLKCERCNYEATKLDQLRDHMKQEHSTVDPNDYHKCSKCDKPFTDKYVKNKHQKYCGLELNLKCTHCYYETTRIERLQAHIQTTHISLVPQF